MQLEPPDVASLESKLKDYQTGEAEALQTRVQRLADKTASYVEEIPPAAQEVVMASSASTAFPQKMRKKRKKRVVDDASDDNDLQEHEEKTTFTTHHTVVRDSQPMELWKEVKPLSTWNRRSRVLGLDAAVQKGTSARLLQILEPKPAEPTPARQKPGEPQVNEPEPLQDEKTCVAHSTTWVDEGRSEAAATITRCDHSLSSPLSVPQVINLTVAQRTSATSG